MPFAPHTRLLRAAFAALGLLALMNAYAAPAATPAPRPNFVFVLIDDAGFSDFGAYGSEIKTPNIDAIAAAGVRFTNFHTASTCESSRAMLHSGVDHHRAGTGTLTAVIADNQRGKPGYEGFLNDRTHSLGQLLKDGGYATYFAGKWNLGDGLARAPGAKGWDRYIALEQTGADNFEAKVYAPLNREAIWWEDGQRAQLPKDFFSTRHYVDRLLQYIDDGKASGKPFFATLALQAVHSPLQAPDADIAKYKDVYAAGWERLRAQRYQRQVDMGLMPAGLPVTQAVGARAWDAMSASDQRLYAKKMQVFAAMLDNADQQIGRLRAHLKQTGQLDNTVFIVMSDNGADAYELNRLNLPFRLWYRSNFDLDFERLGQPGSYVHYGQDWAAVSNTPLRSFKGTSFEGGMRVPFILSYPAQIRAATTNEFAYATDFLPTMLELAGIALPGDNYQGKSLLRPTGASMLPYLQGQAAAIHGSTEAIGFEGTGAEGLYQGDYKITRNVKPFADGEWHLYNYKLDPTESNDLGSTDPARLHAMRAEFETYLQRNGVVKPEAGYDPLRQLLKNNWPVLVQQLRGVLIMAAVLLIALIVGAVWGVRRWRRRTA